MIVLKERIALMERLGRYMLGQDPEWMRARENAQHENAWFTPEYIQHRVQSIGRHFLQASLLEAWAMSYPALSAERADPPCIGLVMAGNIPLVGFHDFLSIFISGCKQKIKLSSKDSILWNHLVGILKGWEPKTAALIEPAPRLNDCAGYIATGSNNSSRYFDYYFGKFPNIIRRNRSSIAILTGNESSDSLELLSDDINLYFGLGCRNVSKIWVPEGYDFIPLLQALEKYKHHIQHHKYKNNYDYQLALYLLNKVPYRSNDTHLLVPSSSVFAPLSVLHYEYYSEPEQILSNPGNRDEIQTVVSEWSGVTDLPQISEGLQNMTWPSYSRIKPGESQQVRLNDYADGIDTLAFLNKVKKR